MKFSSAFKVGLLTLVALVIFIFSILWIKGRSLSSGQRITVEFKDVNGMRPGSSVQLMGFRVGQVEEIEPIVKDNENFVKIKFVITEPNVSIPDASIISIQQSGLIGEQFLEIMPPKIRYIYLPVDTIGQILHINDDVQMCLGDKMYDVGIIKSVDVVDKGTVSPLLVKNIYTKNVYKIGYIITTAGLILPQDLNGKIIDDSNGITKLRIILPNAQKMDYPKTKSKYTIVEPLRLSDFLEIQYQAAQSLTQTNEKIAKVLSDSVILDLQKTAENIKVLTQTANTTISKAQMLIEKSSRDIDSLMDNVNRVSNSIIVMSDNINKFVEDPELRNTIITTASSVKRLSVNLNTLIEDPKTLDTLDNINKTSENLAQISSYINDTTKDEKLKANLSKTVCKFNMALDQLSITLDTVNQLTANDKEKIKQTLDDINITSKNMRKFSEKLNKRFLIFRLLF